MNVPINQTSSHPSEPVRTPENPLEYEWLTVDEAVAFCAERGLSRTPKTLRKWAERSYNKEDADITVRREDTMWSYRWKIEKASLARKVDQELSLAGANASEPVRTGATETAENTTVEPENTFEPVRTGAGMISETNSDQKPSKTDEPRANASEPVRTGSVDIRPAGVSANVLEEVRERLRDKEEEIAFLRGQLDKAQAEVERRATSTDEALKTIDRVVRSFEMQAEANKALALSGVSSRTEPSEPVRFTEEAEMSPTEQPTPPEHNPASRYQQPEPGWHRV
ncbi:hypothetical protein [Aestuariivita sp.]|uniref:hypothetical protein n=1 Tax=Aestuariivita sp. TaxID=1872407 RepID=UPI0021701A5C|nr:hypothetical protein [Aestuariivita sp.]MCE8006009.1 hypothetical protein [Aestuariivita sp.]